MKMNEIIKLVGERKFAEAKKVVDDGKVVRLSGILTVTNSENELLLDELLIYKFMCYLIKSEKNKEKLAEYHYETSVYLTWIVSYLPFSFKKGIFHAKKAVELSQGNLKYKELLIIIYHHPESEGLYSKKEAVALAKDILIASRGSSFHAKRLLELFESDKDKLKKRRQNEN